MKAVPRCRRKMRTLGGQGGEKVSFPPGSAPSAGAIPAVGDRHIVDTGVSGTWAGQAGFIAVREDTGWQFHVPQEGWLAWR